MLVARHPLPNANRLKVGRKNGEWRHAQSAITTPSQIGNRCKTCIHSHLINSMIASITHHSDSSALSRSDQASERVVKTGPSHLIYTQPVCRQCLDFGRVAVAKVPTISGTWYPLPGSFGLVYKQHTTPRTRRWERPGHFRLAFGSGLARGRILCSVVLARGLPPVTGADKVLLLFAQLEPGLGLGRYNFTQSWA